MKNNTSSRAYFIVNIILGGAILLIMGYSALFSPEKNNYPVVCIHEQLTGQHCPSCGLSHAFSLMVRGRFKEAVQWNENAPGVFLFFVIQLFFRAGLAIWLYNRERRIRTISLVDAFISAVMAAVVFYPFMLAQLKLLI